MAGGGLKGILLGSLLMGSFEAEKQENGVKDESRCNASKGVHK